MSNSSPLALGREHAQESPRSDPASHPSESSVPRSADALLETAEDLASSFAIEASLRDRERVFPGGELRQLEQSGLLAARVPKRLAGPEHDFSVVARALVRISIADTSLGQLPENHFHLAENAFVLGNQRLQHELAQYLLQGGRLGNAFSEKKRATNDPRTELTTRATRSGEDYVITGRKYYATGALTAGIVPVTAESPEGSKLLAFVDRQTAGLTVTDDWNSFGQVGTHSGSVHLDRVRVPGYRVIAPWVEERRTSLVAILLHTAVNVGAAAANLSEARAVLRTEPRTWLGNGATEDPLVLRQLGDLYARVLAVETLYLSAAEALDRAIGSGLDDHYAEAERRVFAASGLSGETAVRAADEIFEFGGASSTDRSRNLSRFWRNARTHSLHFPTRIALLNAGRGYLLETAARTGRTGQTT
ncbi:acyl-CoA dehydrogenase family protein [Leucobacter weissii]|uniref:Dibenzothiophene monooxygenase n=1 Tax=Leucobacter weissii TaxID=1983706 RepID=A0A939MQK0_9MICO|nr:acyl-CoA dehydrogenase family protein [Leucobacter weissii]MBO1903107.1 acyl-CoA dehydrogenase family protein [Leucobacter weissii]